MRYTDPTGHYIQLNLERRYDQRYSEGQNTMSSSTSSNTIGNQYMYNARQHRLSNYLVASYLQTIYPIPPAPKPTPESNSPRPSPATQTTQTTTNSGNSFNGISNFFGNVAHSVSSDLAGVSPGEKILAGIGIASLGVLVMGGTLAGALAIEVSTGGIATPVAAIGVVDGFAVGGGLFGYGIYLIASGWQESGR